MAIIFRMIGLVNNKGRRIVSHGPASDNGQSRNPGKTGGVIRAQDGAAGTTFDQSLRSDLPAPFPGLFTRGFLAPRVSLRYTLGYDSVVLAGLKAALCTPSRVSRQKVAMLLFVHRYSKCCHPASPA